MDSNSVWQTLRRVDFKKGDVLFKEGDHGFFFYILQEGKVEVYHTDENGKEKSLSVIESGQPLGEFALITESLRSASARALSDGFAVEVSEDGYKKLLADLPEWAIAVFQSLIRRLKEANERLNNSAKENFHSTEAYSLFLDETTQRFTK
ncbi:MAG: Crp/Fnr family transcriptional regulator [Bdellovibrionales bacterium]